jgi:hypothetical protein
MVDSEALFQKVEALNFEGTVMKDSVYSGFQSRDWLTVRTSSGNLRFKDESKRGADSCY